MRAGPRHLPLWWLFFPPLAFAVTLGVSGGTLVSPLEAAYVACERHLVSVCGEATCFLVCAHREGVVGCTSPYQWRECDDVAKRWLGSAEYVRQVEAEKEEERKATEADHELVRRAHDR